ncbi:MAG: hypothetical protein HY075_09605 [Deltaproteobacteria bacterium]|nr:hypothetical protein [Deltaproteobacteria bacterium]
MLRLLLVPLALAAGGSDCEKKIAATKAYFLPSDPKLVCDTNPSPATVDCMVEILTKTKDKLRNNDFLEAYSLCRVDSSRQVRDCVLSKLDKQWNDPGYKGLRMVGDQCLLARKEYPVKTVEKKRQPPAPPVQASTPKK